MPYLSIEDIWRRANVPVSVLIKLANADAYLPSLGLSRRDALWKIKALRDEALPLFVAADERANRLREEIDEPEVELKPMTAGRQVVEDYRHIGFTLRDHPVSFLREALSQRRTVTCQKANSSKDGTWLNAAGLVLVRQKPGSAKGVMFITIEDETAACNLVIWPSKYEEYRRIIFSAGMIAAQGRIQREGEVVHLVVHRLFDLSDDLASVGNIDFQIAHGRGDEVHHGGGPDYRAPDASPITKARDIFIPDLHLDSIKVKTRDFR